MPEDFDIKNLSPIRDRHSISEVIFSVTLASPIINTGKYEALVKEGGSLYNDFQSFKRLSGIKVGMKMGPKGWEKTPDTGFTGNDGFSIEKFVDGKLSWVIGYQPSNDSSMPQVLKLHCLAYQRWSSFFNEVVKLFTVICEFDELYASGYSLYYLDQFYWKKPELPDMTNIFKKGGLYLSNLFFETKGVWNFASNSNRTIEEKLITENIHIGIRHHSGPEGNYIIYLFHNALTMFDEYRNLKKLISEEEINSLAAGMHNLNKDFLAQTLTTPIQILIGLNPDNL